MATIEGLHRELKNPQIELVTAVVLRMPWTATMHDNSQRHPPGRKYRQAVPGLSAGKGRAVVDQDSNREPKSLEKLFKLGSDRVCIGLCHELSG